MSGPSSGARPNQHSAAGSDDGQQPDVLIAMISSTRGKGGISTHVSSVVAGLTASGVTVRVVEPISGRTTQALLFLPRVVRRIVPKVGVPLERRSRRVVLEQSLRRQFRRDAPSVVYAQDPLAASAALRISGAAGPPVVMVVHFNESQAEELVQGGSITRGSRVERSIRQFEAELLPRLDGIVYVSGYMQRQIEQDVPAAASVRSTVIPNFLPDLEVSPDPGLALRDCLSVGSLVPRKNHAYLLRVLRAAKCEGKRHQLTVAGAGRDREALERLAIELGVGDQVVFTGHRDDVDHLMRQHRVYVHSATMDNCPFVLIEALRCGLPIVAAAVGGIPEVVGTDGAGLVWDLDDPEGGAAVLAGLLDDDQALADAGRLARARFDDRFSEDVVCQRLLDFLTTTRDSSSRPRTAR